MEVKPGVKTSEFWIALVSSLVGLGALFGLFSQAEAESLVSVLEKLVGAAAALAVAILPVVEYIKGRAKVKAG